MAENETRLETLEDEVKVLKGEVKRTLVDLRALLMREDSPLGEGAAAKRMAMQNATPANQGGSPAAVTPPAPRPEAPVQPPVPEAPPRPGPGAFPGLDVPQAIPQAMSGPGPGPPPGPAANPQDVVPPGAPPADNLQVVAPQEPTMPERERPMAEPENDPGAPRANAPRTPAGAESGDQHQFPDGLENAFAEAGPDGGPEEDEPSKAPGQKGRSRLSGTGLKAGLEERLRLDSESGKDQARGESKSDARGKSERVTSIYDEYRELLEETQQTHTIEDEPVGPPLDVNLMANLVYWASLAKQRVGEAQLKDILHLYIQSGHSRPELQDLLLHICKMVDVEAAIVEENGSDWVDLLFHLHGILTGGFPVIKIPYIGLLVREDS